MCALDREPFPGRPDAIQDRARFHRIAFLGLVDHRSDNLLDLTFAECVESQQGLGTRSRVSCSARISRLARLHWVRLLSVVWVARAHCEACLNPALAGQSVRNILLFLPSVKRANSTPLACASCHKNPRRKDASSAGAQQQQRLPLHVFRAFRIAAPRAWPFCPARPSRIASASRSKCRAIEETGDAVSRQRAVREPVLDAVGVDLHALAILWKQRIPRASASMKRPSRNNVATTMR